MRGYQPAGVPVSLMIVWIVSAERSYAWHTTCSIAPSILWSQQAIRYSSIVEIVSTKVLSVTTLEIRKRLYISEILASAESTLFSPLGNGACITVLTSNAN